MDEDNLESPHGAHQKNRIRESYCIPNRTFYIRQAYNFSTNGKFRILLRIHSYQIIPELIHSLFFESKHALT